MPDTDQLRADCTRCFGLCCVVPTFAAAADFAIDKPAGSPCPNLRTDFSCGIHRDLRDRGFTGCTVYDCFGAGQHVSQVTFGGTDWRSDDDTAQTMFAVFPAMRALHELLWYVAAALELDAATPLRTDLEAEQRRIAALTETDAATVTGLDIDALRGQVNPVLLQASELARSSGGPAGADHRGADLTGAHLAGSDLRRASLRGALLCGADLRDADLMLADLTGTDLRGTDLGGAKLADAIFVTQSQLEAARGDAATTLPGSLTRPSHWS